MKSSVFLLVLSSFGALLGAYLAIKGLRDFVQTRNLLELVVVALNGFSSFMCCRSMTAVLGSFIKLKLFCSHGAVEMTIERRLDFLKMEKKCCHCGKSISVHQSDWDSFVVSASMDAVKEIVTYVEFLKKQSEQPSTITEVKSS